MLEAYVNRGMWVAECQCKNALALAPIAGAEIEGIDWPKDSTLFKCSNCGDVHVIMMPVQRAEIEALLIVRPEANRNWFVYESVADLRIENAAHSKELI